MCQPPRDRQTLRSIRQIQPLRRAQRQPCHPDAVLPSCTVVDARAADRYAGRVEPVDPRAGHIPGAVNVPFVGNLDEATRRFIGPDALADRYRDAGVDDPSCAIVYCGSGVTACHDLLAMEHAGLVGARLYPGSWSQWCNDPSRPVSTGTG